MSLFKRAPDTLDGFTPKFSREFLRFGYKLEKYQIGGGLGDMDFDRRDIKFGDRHTITILDATLSTDSYFSYTKSVNDIVATLCNDFLKKPENEKNHPQAWEFLKENAVDLNISKRYWAAMDHLAQIERVRQEAADLQDQVRRAEFVASINAVEVRSGRALTQDERNMLYAEFSGGETPGE